MENKPIKVSKRKYNKLYKERFKGCKEPPFEEWMEFVRRYDVQENPIKKFLGKVKRIFNPKKYIKLGKIYAYDEVPCVKNVDKRVTWSADEYLAAILRDYIRMIEKNEYHIGAAAFDEFPFMPHNKMINGEETEEEIAAAKRWHEILLETADMFDEYLTAMRDFDMDFNYQEHLDKTFDNMKKIFMDLWN